MEESSYSVIDARVLNSYFDKFRVAASFQSNITYYRQPIPTQPWKSR